MSQKPFQKALNLRALKLETVASQEIFDLVVIGGGTHGAFVALDAACRGYSVLLLEAKDYASGTSSRSSKLLHGGVRYLEQGHIGLVAKAIRERSCIRELAPHLSRVCPFLFCVSPPKTRPAWQVKIGLFIYSFFNRIVSRKDARAFDVETSFKNISNYSESLKNFGLKFSALLRYSDGQMDDTRIVVESIVAAEKKGAFCFNYSKVEKITRNKDDFWNLEWCDELENKNYSIKAKKIVNVTGPAVKQVHDTCFKDKSAAWKSSWPEPVFSTGVHLFFDTPWDFPGLILPAEKEGRYYFVLPLFSPYETGVVVGTTDVASEKGHCHPEPSEQEIELILSFLEKDFPKSGLNKKNLFHVTSGMRVMAARSGTGEVSNVSREEEILIAENYVALLGGKYTTSRLTAEKIVDLLGDRKCRLSEMGLPGAKGYDQQAVSSLKDLELKATYLRFGSKADEIIANSKIESSSLHAAQIQYCIENEHAVYAEDLMKYRLGLSKCPSSLGFRHEFEKALKDFRAHN